MKNVLGLILIGLCIILQDVAANSNSQSDFGLLLARRPRSLEELSHKVEALETGFASLTSTTGTLQQNIDALKEQNLLDIGILKGLINQRTCSDWYRLNSVSGLRYLVKKNHELVLVYCDQETDGGRWNVFQRREDGTVDFNKGWSEYRDGFGNPLADFWLGLENLHSMTNDGQKYQLRFDLEKNNGSKYHAVYDDFSIGSKEEGYPLRFSKFSYGNATDSLYNHNGVKFSTKDHPNPDIKENCSEKHTGGWWFFKACYTAALNGQYNGTDAKGIHWYALTQFEESLKSTEMKFRIKEEIN